MSGRVLIVTLALCAVAAGLGLWLGVRPGPTEAEVIEAGAALYAAETGGARTDCVGLPARGTGWIEVRCGDGAGLRVYVFDERGGLLPSEGEPMT